MVLGLATVITWLCLSLLSSPSDRTDDVLWSVGEERSVRADGSHRNILDVGDASSLNDGGSWRITIRP